MNSRHKNLILRLVRMAFGILWLDGAHWKNPPYFGLYSGADLYYWVKTGSEHPVLGLYTELVKTIVLPNFIFFGWLIFLTELTLGLVFLFGFKIRFFSIVAILYTINIALNAAKVPGEWIWSYLLMIMVSLLLFAFSQKNDNTIQKKV